VSTELDGTKLLPVPTARQEPEKKGDDKKSLQPPEAKEPEKTPEAAPEPKKAEEPPAPPAATPDDRWALMKILQGTLPGTAMYDHRQRIWGWTTASFTPSTSTVDNNLPVVWNDRANRALLNQNWLRYEQSVLTSGTTSPTWGFRVDAVYGSDYRWMLPRGFLNSQLDNFNGNINTNGFDSPSHYLEVYVPTIAQGLDIKVGRFFTPFGYESLETISSPLVSKAYGFNWFPPFTHVGGLATLTINPRWTAQLGLVNGNDVYIGDPSEELRALATLKYTHPNKRDVITFGTSIGRGKFNQGEPYNPATYGLMTEPAGRNNINVFDLVWTHVVNSRVNYACELGYGYQTNVPANVPGGIISEGATEGTAHWAHICHYLLINLTQRTTGVVRFELFDDFEGQRTGFEGLYTAVTLGVQYKPYPWLMFRPEIRYDYNGYSMPFSNGTSHDLFTAGMDLTVRW
jgi:hypothetical protein